jgi:hypothetical protein
VTLGNWKTKENNISNRHLGLSYFATYLEIIWCRNCNAITFSFALEFSPKRPSNVNFNAKNWI